MPNLTGTSIALATLTGTFIDFAGAAIAGSVTFTPAASAVLDGTSNKILMARPIIVGLSGAGAFTVDLPVTDDPDGNPTGFTYTVVENFTNGRTYSIALPAGGPYDLADIAPASSSNAGTVAYTAPRPIHLVVASADAPTTVKNGADYVCDGTADQVEIQAALDKAAPVYANMTTNTKPHPNMPSSAEQLGKVELSGGRFNMSGGVQMWDATHLQGQGFLSELRCASNITTAVGNGSGVALIKGARADAHLLTVSDLYMYGNYSGGGSVCGAIEFDGSGGTDTGGYPGTSPDSYHTVERMFIDGFDHSTGARNGIKIWATTSAKQRGGRVSDIQMRNISGNGIEFNKHSDGFISNCHVGTVRLGSAFYIIGGNTKLANNKSFYVTAGYGFYFGASRIISTGLESQDDYNGVMLDGSPGNLTGVLIDTWSQNGLTVSSSYVNVHGLSMLNRYSAGVDGRYATSNLGIYVDATNYVGCQILGNMDLTRTTTQITAGTPLSAANGNYLRVSSSGALLSVG